MLSYILLYLLLGLVCVFLTAYIVGGKAEVHAQISNAPAVIVFDLMYKAIALPPLLVICSLAAGSAVFADFLSDIGEVIINSVHKFRNFMGTKRG